MLVVDIGNTNITFGIFKSDILSNIFRLPSDINISQKEYESLFKNNFKNMKINRCVIGSVVDGLGQNIKKIIDSYFGINSILLDSNMNFGIKLHTPNPEKMGIDRIANIAAAKKYSNPAIIIDLGTATTFDITNKNGDFWGGIIIPGVNIQLKSLHDYTSKLPLIEPEAVENVIAHNTKDCILSGVIKGHACAIEGLIEECEKELGEKAAIIGTGGFCALISNHMTRKFDYIEPNLTLLGLMELSKTPI